MFLNTFSKYFLKIYLKKIHFQNCFLKKDIFEIFYVYVINNMSKKTGIYVLLETLKDNNTHQASYC